MNCRTTRLTPEQRAEIKARVATWLKLTEAQRESVRALFDGHKFPTRHDQKANGRVHQNPAVLRPTHRKEGLNQPLQRKEGVSREP